MTLDDIRRLLALASAYDPRNSPTNPDERQAKAIAWHLALHDLDYDAAKNAAIDHYRASTDTLMPADVIRRATTSTSQTGVIHTQQPPCGHCGLQPTHRTHTEHDYQPAFPEPRPAELEATPAIDWHHELQQARDA